MEGIKKQIRDNKYLNWILIFSNWLFQGIIHADRTEKVYKILFTVCFWVATSLAFFVFSSYNLITCIIIGFFLAHTLNWIVNGNFIVLLGHRLKITKLSKKNLFLYLDYFREKLKYQNWILYAASFGSICKGKLKDSSDIDISIVRKPGLKHAILSILFSFREKKIADYKGIPLEIYISDSPENSINRFGGEKNPLVLHDPQNIIDKYYKEKLSLEEAQRMNIIE